MSQMNASKITSRLNDLFRNERAEVGLEVGVDACLSLEHHIQIPESLFRSWLVHKVGIGG